MAKSSYRIMMTHMGAITLVIVQKLLPDADNIIWLIIPIRMNAKKVLIQSIVVWFECCHLSFYHFIMMISDDTFSFFRSTDRIRSFTVFTVPTLLTLDWRHNDHDGVSNHQPHGCLLNRLFRHRSKKTSKPRVTGLCVGNSPGPVIPRTKG